MLATETGDLAEARRALDDCLTLRRGLGDRRGWPKDLHNLGYLAQAADDDDRAAALSGESLALARAVGDARIVGFALVNLGLIQRRRGDRATARGSLREGLTHHAALGEVGGCAEALEALAALAADDGDGARAARWLAAAATARTAHGVPASPAPRAEVDRRVADLRAGLGVARFDAAWAAGAALPLADAIAEALADRR